MKIRHIYKKCIGCGTCAAICPEYFDMGEDGLAHLKNAAFDEQDDEVLEISKVVSELKDALDSCPVQIIKLEESL